MASTPEPSTARIRRERIGTNPASCPCRVAVRWISWRPFRPTHRGHVLFHERSMSAAVTCSPMPPAGTTSPSLLSSANSSHIHRPRHARPARVRPLVLVGLFAQRSPLPRGVLGAYPHRGRTQLGCASGTGHARLPRIHVRRQPGGGAAREACAILPSCVPIGPAETSTSTNAYLLSCP
jgi:hypothetical protein